jgi:hypothetical protein
MLLQQLVNKMTPQQVCSKLVNKLWQCCSNNLSTRCLLNRFVASLLTSSDNASLFQQLVNKMSPQQACIASLLTSCDNAIPTRCLLKLESVKLHLCNLLYQSTNHCQPSYRPTNQSNEPICQPTKWWTHSTNHRHLLSHVCQELRLMCNILDNLHWTRSKQWT